MNLEVFIARFCEELEVENVEEVNAETEFHLMDEWSSLSALTIIAMIDEEFNVPMKGEEMRAAVTIQDLYDIIQSKIA